MIQTEFPFVPDMLKAAESYCKKRMAPDTKNAINYTLRLGAALRILNLTHAVHDVMCAVAALQNAQGFATIPKCQQQLHCTYQAVAQHFLKNPEIFHRDDSHNPSRYTLTPVGIEVMGKIRYRMRRLS